MLIRAILPQWASEESPNLRKVLEGEFTQDQIDAYNGQGYNIYYLPNHPAIYDPNTIVSGCHIDQFNYVYVDMDLKEGKYKSKQEFISYVQQFPALEPTLIVDSGNGVHVYWKVSDLDAMSFLRLQRRLLRQYRTDEAVGQIYQLLRVPGTYNTKNKEEFKLCQTLIESDKTYTCEQMDAELPPITHGDEAYCKQHFDRTYKINQVTEVDDKIPLKFAQLLKSNQEVKEIWTGQTDDRSKGDYRLGHIMYGSGLTRDEAISTLVNSAKAIERAPIHRIAYATGIVDKIWVFEETVDKTTLNLSSTVKEILQKNGDSLKGTRFPCFSYLDDTLHGFRLGQVIGLVAGSGVGKTAVALNMFMGFVQNNPDYHHFFIPLEQPAREIADRWKTMCGDRTYLYEKVHVISNYDDNGAFRHLGLSDIEDYIVKFQELTGNSVGSVVIDHIGALKKKGRNGENQDLMDICHSMKAFAQRTNTMLVMQSQAPREKAGIGDLELNKDAAYGTVYFESYCDYLITVWQPLKRCYKDPACPTVTAFKFCKIRHKKVGMDKIQEDVPYRVYFDPKTEHMAPMTQLQEKAFDFYNKNATNKRKEDRKTDLVQYTTITWSDDAKVKDSQNAR